jgi:hypothetical protein
MHEVVEGLASFLPPAFFQSSVLIVGLLVALASFASNIFFWKTQHHRNNQEPVLIEGMTLRFLGDDKIELLISDANELEQALSNHKDQRQLNQRDVEVLLGFLEERSGSQRKALYA